MQGERVSGRLVRAMSALATFAVSAASVASPFSVTYTGTISGSSFAQIINGQSYTVTLVVDNGNATAVSQSWAGTDLKCVIFSMNNAGNVQYAQDLAATNAELTVPVNPVLQTFGDGTLENIQEVVDNSPSGPPAGTFSFTGFTPVNPINWFLNQANNVFYSQYSSGPSFGDASGGVVIDPANWTNPVPFTGACAVGGGGGGGLTPSPVPTMSGWMIALLALLLSLGSVAILRRRS